MKEAGRTEQQFVILKVFSGIGDNQNGMYHSGDLFQRYDVYLEFYENSPTGADYFKNKSKYAGRVLRQGKRAKKEDSQMASKFETKIPLSFEQAKKQIKKLKGATVLPLAKGEDISCVEGYHLFSKMIENEAKLFKYGERLHKYQ